MSEPALCPVADPFKCDRACAFRIDSPAGPCRAIAATNKTVGDIRDIQGQLWELLHSIRTDMELLLARSGERS